MKTQKTTLRALALVFAVSVLAQPAAQAGFVDNLTAYWNSFVEIAKEKGSSLVSTIKENPKTSAAVLATLAASGMAYYFLKGGKKAEKGTEKVAGKFGINAQGEALVHKVPVTGQLLTQAQVSMCQEMQNKRLALNKQAAVVQPKSSANGYF